MEAVEAAERELLRNIRGRLDALRKLATDDDREAEDFVYRYYHQSFKVYGLQALTEQIVEHLRAIAPADHPLASKFFLERVERGTGKKFELSHNDDWHRHAGPILEAYFHARYFLAMAIEYGKTIKKPPQFMPSGWAALRSLYRLG